MEHRRSRWYKGEWCAVFSSVYKIWMDLLFHTTAGKTVTRVVEIYRRYVAFVYLYETAHRHVREGSNSYRRITNDVMCVKPNTINDKTHVLIDCHLHVLSLFLVQRTKALPFSFARICKLYFVTYVVKYSLKKTCPVRGRADKSLTLSTSRCRRTESIVSLKERSVHVPNFKAFLVEEAERKHNRGRAQFEQHRNTSFHQFFPLQGKSPKEIHAILR
jgi:hypothetical protein